MSVRFATMLLVSMTCYAAGCKSKQEVKFVTVEGRVLVAGKPLTSGQIGFIPDESRGATHPEYSIGEMQSDGTFKLVTNDKNGVRPGWYKVVVWASVEPMPATPSYDANGQLKPIAWLVATKYTTKESTDLQIEVVENPPSGAYDLNLDPP